MILTSTLLPAAMALGTVLPAQESVSKDAPANPALQRALDTISAEEIKADLMFVASDEMAAIVALCARTSPRFRQHPMQERRQLQ